MNEQEKSLELAKLMGWEVWKCGKENHINGLHMDIYDDMTLCPYTYGEEGLVQFAAVLLKNYKVIEHIADDYNLYCDFQSHEMQKLLLDEILIMNGVEI